MEHFVDTNYLALVLVQWFVVIGLARVTGLKEILFFHVYTANDVF